MPPSSSTLLAALLCLASASVLTVGADPARLSRQPLTKADAAVQEQWFLSGACLDATPRLEALPGRIFTDFSNVNKIDPVEFGASYGMNAVRLATTMGQCLGPSRLDNSPGWPEREKLFTLDLGCIDLQVRLAQRAKAVDAKVVHAINMGSPIPTAWLRYSYPQMLAALAKETSRHIQPFLDAGVQPDVVLFGTEETDGILKTELLPNGYTHERGILDQYTSWETYERELCGQIPTGSTAAWPQLAGYYKQMAATISARLTAAGMDPTLTRYGLHSHGQYFPWKTDVVYNQSPSAETSIQQGNISCSARGIVPEPLYSTRAADVLDIMGFSGYPNPSTPVTMDKVGYNATFAPIYTNLAAAKPVVERFGKHASGPFKGQYVKQVLLAETGMSFVSPNQMPFAAAAWDMFFKIFDSLDWVLGALYWEPFYGRNYWEGGRASLYREDPNGPYRVTPIDTFKRFFAFARSGSGTQTTSTPVTSPPRTSVSTATSTSSSTVVQPTVPRNTAVSKGRALVPKGAARD